MVTNAVHSPSTIWQKKEQEPLKEPVDSLQISILKSQTQKPTPKPLELSETKGVRWQGDQPTIAEKLTDQMINQQLKVQDGSGGKSSGEEEDLDDFSSHDISSQQEKSSIEVEQKPAWWQDREKIIMNEEQKKYIHDLVDERKCREGFFSQTLSSPFNEGFQQLSDLHHLFDKGVASNNQAAVMARAKIKKRLVKDQSKRVVQKKVGVISSPVATQWAVLVNQAYAQMVSDKTKSNEPPAVEKESSNDNSYNKLGKHSDRSSSIDFTDLSEVDQLKRKFVGQEFKYGDNKASNKFKLGNVVRIVQREDEKEGWTLRSFETDLDASSQQLDEDLKSVKRKQSRQTGQSAGSGFICKLKPRSRMQSSRLSGHSQYSSPSQSIAESVKRSMAGRMSKEIQEANALFSDPNTFESVSMSDSAGQTGRRGSVQP